MLNQAVLVGRIVKEPELKTTESGKKVSNITLAVPRSFKNSNGEYDTDFMIPIIYSDSAYCVNTINDWMYRWERNGWLKSNNTTPENLDLI